MGPVSTPAMTQFSSPSYMLEISSKRNNIKLHAVFYKFLDFFKKHISFNFLSVLSKLRPLEPPLSLSVDMIILQVSQYFFFPKVSSLIFSMWAPHFHS